MPERAQLSEEALRVADAGDRVHAAARPSRRVGVTHRDRRRLRHASGSRRIVRIAHGRGGHGRRARATLAPVTRRTTASTLGESRCRLAQRTRRQQQPVAEAARRVDHDDLDVARECVVLQAIVGDDHIDVRMRVEQPARRLRALAVRSTPGSPDAASSSGSSPTTRGSSSRTTARAAAALPP